MEAAAQLRLAAQWGNKDPQMGALQELLDAVEQLPGGLLLRPLDELGPQEGHVAVEQVLEGWPKAWDRHSGELSYVVL